MESNKSESTERPRRCSLQFSLRSLFLLFLIVALVLGWWIDRRRLTKRIELREKQIWLLEQPKGMAGPTEQNRFASADEFLQVLRSARNENEFLDAAGPFAATDVAIEALPGLRDLLRDPDPEIRSRSLTVLAWMGRRAARAVPEVIPLLEDESPLVRGNAMWMLGECGDAARDALPALRRRMLDDDSPEAGFATATVSKIDSSAEVGDRLCQLLHNKLPANRWTAAQYLPDHVEASVARRLLEARHEIEDDPTTRDIIAMSLNRLGQ